MQERRMRMVESKDNEQHAANKLESQAAKNPPDTPEQPPDESRRLFDVRFDGAIPQGIARVFNALCCWLEEIFKAKVKRLRRKEQD